MTVLTTIEMNNFFVIIYNKFIFYDLIRYKILNFLVRSFLLSLTNIILYKWEILILIFQAKNLT